MNLCGLIGAATVSVTPEDAVDHLKEGMDKISDNLDQRQKVETLILRERDEIYGICSDCLEKRTPLMPLMLAKPGEQLIIKEINGGRGLPKRMTDMGLRPNDEIEVITCCGKGHFVIAVGGKRFVLGRGMVQKIFVEPK